MKLVFVDEEYALGVYDPEKLIVKIYWKGKQNSEQYRNTLQKAIDLMLEHKVKYYLSDIRQQRIVSPEDRKWFQEVAMPSAIKNGLERAVVIFAGNVFKKYYLNNIFNASKKFGLPLKFFYSEEEAEEWLFQN